MSTRTRKILSVVLGIFAVFGYGRGASAAIIVGQSSSEEVLRTSSVAQPSHYMRLGRIYGGATFDRVYITYDDESNTGYLTKFVIGLCNYANYTNDGVSSACTQYVARAAVGATTEQSVAMTGDNTKKTVMLDFSIRALYTGGTDNGVAGAITVTGAQYVYLSFEGDSQVSGLGTNKETTVYGTSTSTQDAYGNFISVGSGTQVCTSNCATPFYYVADDNVEWAEQANYGFATPASESHGFALSGAKTFCQTMASGVASSSTAFGIPYGLTFAGCYIPGVVFIPSKDSVDFVFEQAGLVRQKVPYVYFDQFRTAWASASGAAAQEFPVVSVPWGVMGASTSIAVVSSASFTRWVSASVLSSLRDLTTVAFYVSFGWYAWNRTRKLFRGI